MITIDFDKEMEYSRKSSLQEYNSFNDKQKDFFKNMIRNEKLVLIYTMFDKEFNELYTLFELEEYYNSHLITVMIEEATKILTMRFDAFYIYPHLREQILEEDILKEKKELKNIMSGNNIESNKRGRL